VMLGDIETCMTHACQTLQESTESRVREEFRAKAEEIGKGYE